MVRDARAHPLMRDDNEYGESSKSSKPPKEVPWYCIQVKRGKEGKAFKFLFDQGYKPFFPCIRQDETRRRRVPLSGRPFLPGYMFVQIDAEEQGFHAVRNTRGVIRILSYNPNGAPAVVPPELIEALLRRVEDDGGLIRMPKRELPTFKAGDGVPVRGGPLSGHVGTFEELYVEDDEVRITLALDVMGHRKSITFPLAHIAPE